MATASPVFIRCTHDGREYRAPIPTPYQGPRVAVLAPSRAAMHSRGFQDEIVKRTCMTILQWLCETSKRTLPKMAISDGTVHTWASYPNRNSNRRGYVAVGEDVTPAVLGEWTLRVSQSLPSIVGCLPYQVSIAPPALIPGRFIYARRRARVRLQGDASEAVAVRHRKASAEQKSTARRSHVKPGCEVRQRAWAYRGCHPASLVFRPRSSTVWPLHGQGVAFGCHGSNLGKNVTGDRRRCARKTIRTSLGLV